MSQLKTKFQNVATENKLSQQIFYEIDKTVEIFPLDYK